jgi:hypothetical protein
MSGARARRLPKLRKIDVRVPVATEPVAGRPTPLLDLVERTVLVLVDGRSTVNSLAQAAEVSEEQMAQALERLEMLGLVEMAEPKKRTKSSPGTRLDSGMRPALKTMPALEEMAATLDQEARTSDLDLDLEEEGVRFTLPGIGPDGEAG